MFQRYSSNIRQILIVCYCSLVLFSCNSSPSKKVDTSAVVLPYQSVRFDRFMFDIDTNRLMQQVDSLGKVHPDFAAVYFKELTGFANGDSANFQASVHHFVTYKDYKQLRATVEEKFNDIASTDRILQQTLKHIRYYFPATHYSKVYYFISGLNNWSAVTIDTLVGVGLDMYLGKDYPFYPSVQLPMYQIERCEPSYIPVNVSKAIYEDMFPIDMYGKTLLEIMIARGKQLAFTAYTNPDLPAELIVGYSPQQYQWAKANEAMVWNYFAEKKLLYSTQWQEMMRYVTDGPTSTGMPPESPGNIGSFIGWQIVETYMQHHPEKSLPEILKDSTDAQTFLRESSYKPHA